MKKFAELLVTWITATAGTAMLWFLGYAVVKSQPPDLSHKPQMMRVVAGKSTAPVTVEVWEDYLCPYCARAGDPIENQILQPLIDQGKVRKVMRDLVIHPPLAQTYAEAVHCAGDQSAPLMWELRGKFQSYIRNLGGDKDPKLPVMYSIVDGVGLDRTKLESCMAKGTYKRYVKNETKEAGRLGLNSTPSFIVGKTTRDGGVDGAELVKPDALEDRFAELLGGSEKQ